MERGVIKYRDRQKQIFDFSGMRWKNITPTDLDVLIDFGDKFFVIAELKVKGVDLPFGQNLAIERLCDNLNASGKISLAIVSEHETKSDEDVNYAETIVKKYRFEGKWCTPEKVYTVRKLIDEFLEKYVPGYLDDNWMNEEWRQNRLYKALFHIK